MRQVEVKVLMVTMGHHRATLGHIRVTLGHLRFTIGIGCLNATVVTFRVTVGHIKNGDSHFRVNI